MNIGDKVRKPRGYGFDGWVVATFTKRDGQRRVVVESEAIPGLLHIFTPEQVEPIDTSTEWEPPPESPDDYVPGGA